MTRRVSDIKKPLSAVIRQNREQSRRVASASAFARSGTSVTDEGVVTVEGNLDVNGNLNVDGPMTINGPAKITGTLDLPAGIIGNESLTSPVAPGSIYDSLTNFGLTPTLTNILTTTITVPPGFSLAAVSVVVRVQAFNNTAGIDYLYAQANIAGYNGYALPLAVPGSGGSGINTSPFSTVLSGLVPGSAFTVQIAASTAFASWAANPSNIAEVSGSVMWFR